MTIDKIDKILKVENLSLLSTDLLILAYKNGYKVEELPNINIDNNRVNETNKSDKIKTETLKHKYEEWKPLNDEQIQEIRSSINSIEPIKLKVLSLSFGIDNLSSCPSKIIQGTQHQIIIQASKGVPPYTFEIFNDNYIPWKDLSGNPWKYTTDSESPISWHNTFNNPSGSHAIIARVTDSQSIPCTSESSYTIIIEEPSIPHSITS